MVPIIEVDAGMPLSIARMYLGWRGWRLRPLNGIASSPLLVGQWNDQFDQGYDANSGMWCESVPDLSVVPRRPTKDQAAAAFRRLREHFKTFCFGDAILSTMRLWASMS